MVSRKRINVAYITAEAYAAFPKELAYKKLKGVHNEVWEAEKG
jgi:hypothetical protein